MKIIKKILLGIVLIIALLLVAGLFMRKDYMVERDIVIKKPNQVVFDYVKILKNQQNYSTWTNSDPNTKITYTGTDGTVGAVSAWSGNKDVGKGEQEIKKITEGQRIDVELRFIEPFEGRADAYFITEAIDSTQTKIKWGIKGEDKYPMNIMQLFINYDDMMGTQFEAGLKNLKTVLEKQ